MKTNADGMGSPEIKYGDSVCYVQHVESGLWLTYQATDAKSARVGGAQRKVNLYLRGQLSSFLSLTLRPLCLQAILHSEGHMDDGLTLSRSQREESHTARLIRSAVLLFSHFIR